MNAISLKHLCSVCSFSLGQHSPKLYTSAFLCECSWACLALYYPADQMFRSDVYFIHFTSVKIENNPKVSGS